MILELSSLLMYLILNFVSTFVVGTSGEMFFLMKVD